MGARSLGTLDTLARGLSFGPIRPTRIIGASIHTLHHGTLIVTDPTYQLTVEEHLGRLSMMAERMRGQLVGLQKELTRSGDSLPPGVLEGLRQLSGTLSRIQDSVEEREQERRNLLALAELGGVINSSLELEVVLGEVIDTLIQLTGAGRAFLMLRDEAGAMETVIARNWERESLDKEEVEVSRTIVERVAGSGESVLTTNAKADPRFGHQESIVAYNLRSILCVPLKVKGELIGVIYADNKVKEGLFTEKERSLLSAFANQAAVALENARLFESVRLTLAEVSELKTLMEDVFASIASGVITSNTDDEVTLANTAAERIMGRSGEALLGSSLVGLLGELDRELAGRVAEVLSEDRPHLGLETDAKIPGRGPVQLSISLSPLKSADEETRGVAVVLEDLTEKRRLEAQRRLFERMVSPAVIDQLDPNSLHLGGQRTEVTTLFADIRGYTAFSEATTPEALVTVLNRYLAVAAEALLAEEGTIDKFLGDAVMAWFNAPVAQPDHSLRAVRAALAIRDAVTALHRELPSELHLSFGVGIHVGDALLGLVGSHQRLDYTAVGECVNIAKRLQEGASAGQILVSEALAEQVTDRALLEPVEPLLAEGFSAPLTAFELRGLR